MLIQARERLPLAMILASAILAALISACSSQKTASTATIRLGPGGNHWRPCSYEAFEWNGGYGIFKVIGNPIGLAMSPGGFVPGEGATIKGDFSGFGKRTIRNDSDNNNLQVDIVYHASSDDALLRRMRQLNCF